MQVITGQQSAAQICRELKIGESLLSRWKNQFLDGASGVFEKESNLAQADEHIAKLERLVGQLQLSELARASDVADDYASPETLKEGGKAQRYGLSPIIGPSNVERGSWRG